MGKKFHNKRERLRHQEAKRKQMTSFADAEVGDKPGVAEKIVKPIQKKSPLAIDQEKSAKKKHFNSMKDKMKKRSFTQRVTTSN